MDNNKKPYTEDEVRTLIEMCESGKTIKEIAVALNRTEATLRQKCKRMNLAFGRQRLNWSDDECKRFSEEWSDPTISNAMLEKHFGRNIIALSSQARRLNLGSREYDDSYLTVHDIMDEMQVSKDRVRGWIKKGLKYHKSKIKPYKYLIDQNDLLKFLEQHQDLFDASKISHYLFTKEPDWLKAKRNYDKNHYNNTIGTVYSDEEFKIIIKMFKQGRTNEEIAKTIHRTPYGIERMLWSMGLSRKTYNAYEIEIIRNNVDTHTIQEIADMLPLRTKAGIIAKCEQLGIKYHSKIK